MPARSHARCPHQPASSAELVDPGPAQTRGFRPLRAWSPSTAGHACIARGNRGLTSPRSRPLCWYLTTFGRTPCATI